MSMWRLSAVIIGLAGCMLACWGLLAQESNIPTPMFYNSEPARAAFLKVYTADGRDEAILTEGGDFVFRSADGKVNLTLKRGEKGDPVHELMATLLVRAALQQWDLKDWRDWKGGK